MKIGFHITFFYVEQRLEYLYRVLSKLLEIPYEIRIYIYTNKRFGIREKFINDVELVICKYWKNNLLNRIFHKAGIINIVHPYYLTWENRKYVEKLIDEFDAQAYLEDDIGFGVENLDYWFKYKEICLKHGYNLGFLRIELNAQGDKYITDITAQLDKLVKLEDQIFIVNDNNPYCGFWIYDKEELKSFIKTKEWKFDFKEYNIREKSAIGQHGLRMTRYKETIIPLIEKNDLYETPESCCVHHLPDNYIGDKWFCQYKFPVTKKKEN